LAGPDCPADATSYFIDGTQPTAQCSPKEMQLEFTADGGVTENPVPLQQTPPVPDAPPAPDDPDQRQQP